jgi:hypothetical protein
MRAANASETLTVLRELVITAPPRMAALRHGLYSNRASRLRMPCTVTIAERITAA